MELQPVLLVEDDDNDVVLFQYAAAKAGLQNPLQVAHTGAEAARFLDGLAPGRPASGPAMVILDIKLPGQSGVELLRHVRKDLQLHDLPVAVLTSSNAPQDIEAARISGASGYFVKSTRLEELVAIVRALKYIWLEPGEEVADRDELARLSLLPVRA